MSQQTQEVSVRDDQPARTTCAPTVQAALHVALLGPVEVLVDGTDVPLSPLERNLLVVLGLSPGTTVSTDRLMDQLWGDRLPAAPRSRVQGLVSSLRRKVGDVLVTRYPGYLLDAVHLGRDLDTCEELVAAAGSASTPAERAELLTSALALWRGEPLDGISAPGLGSQRARLAEQRLSLVEARFEAELELGNHAQLVGDLAEASSAYPLRERLAGLHMTALYRSNRQADALLAYQELRERLADELGSDPCADLRELHATILRGESLPGPVAGRMSEPPAAVVRTRRPSQLPAGDGRFLGRDTELRLLDEAAGDLGIGGEQNVVVVSAPGGLGKTALVVRWAQQASGEFPDGQLFVDLRGDRPDSLTPSDALAAVLPALGVTADLPVALAERVSLYRTLIRGRRLLVVADDAASADQVLALVPPGAGSRLVVTSRRRLPMLAAHHSVREVVLDPLSDEATRQLLQRIVGPERLREPGAGELIRWCGGWPLTVRHVAAKLASRPSQPVAEFVQELHEYADGLVLDGDSRSAHSALVSAHLHLSPGAARLFGRLGLHAGEICLHLAAAAADTSVRRVRRLLDELVAVHLIVETVSGRFCFHEVIGRFARQRAREEEWSAPVVPELVAAPSGGCPDCRVASVQVPAPRSGVEVLSASYV
jgi:DNA-binding SARP family transcriptional activator